MRETSDPPGGTQLVDSAPDDALAIARARRGDAEAFHDLYRNHVRAVYALALRLMADTDDADDLTQEVFIIAWRELAGYRGDSRFSTWLHGITVRMARRHWRGAFRRRRRDENARMEYLAAVRESMPDADLDLERSIAMLPRRMRWALVLHAIHGYTQRETAAILGVAEGTVKAHTHRARQVLKTRMNAHG